jgi:hypothetical protein
MNGLLLVSVAFRLAVGLVNQLRVVLRMAADEKLEKLKAGARIGTG